MIKKIKNKRLIVTFIILFLVFLGGNYQLFSRFLYLDDEEDKKISEQRKTYPLHIARNIQVNHYDGMKGVIKITWEVDPSYLPEFIVGRSKSIIDTKKKALQADIIAIKPSSAVNEAYDFVNEMGDYYYVVLASKRLKNYDIELFKNQNYSVRPININKDNVYYHVKNIKAKKEDINEVKITWKRIPKGGMFYTIYRSRSRIDRSYKLKSVEKIGDVVDKNEFIDRSVSTPGMYYYAVTAKHMNWPERMFPDPDENYTMVGVDLLGKGHYVKGEFYKVRSLAAKLTSHGVQLRWTYTGKEGSRYFRIFRSEKWISKVNLLSEGMFIDDADITKRRYYDTNPPGGKFYYGIVPYGYKSDTILLRGVNITSVPLTIRDTYIAEKKDDRIEEIIPDKEDFKEDHSVPAGDVDTILRRTYFKGKYYGAVKELQDVIPRTDNKIERAKARLFLGRSYAELGQFKKAYNYFLLNDVTRHFPKESIFWQNYTVVRIK